MFRKNLAKATVACAVLFAVQGAASAATVSCTGSGYDISNKVSGTSNCAILAPLDGNQNDNLALINSTGFFGTTNWLLDGKYDGLGGSTTDDSDLFNFTGGALTGTYSYVGGTPQPSQVMFVFKDGNDTNLVAYLLQSPYGSGTYSSPFTDPPFSLEGNSVLHGISHITVYYRPGEGGGDEGGGKVPEPATLALMGLGLLGMSKLRRKS
ncbi:PEP-CTERM sorting domain-containing protein [Massilia phosphatilytica]|nr:PEP-CTERM sorting domain-containing protein [Massilia phosphatilytica]